MKPYKIANTWVDLDNVLACDEDVTIDDSDFYIYGHLVLAFRDERLRIFLEKIKWGYQNGEWGKGEKEIISAKQTWDAFKTAWMNKDKIQS